MITINYNGKKYEPAKYENNTIGKELQSMINNGYLEEIKENKEHTWVDDLQGISKLIEEDVKKEQFTPGQEIEVSNDGEKWEKEPREFLMMTETGKYFCKFNGFQLGWKFARPIDKIELPEFINNVSENQELPEGKLLYKMGLQVELLTKAFNQLISK